MSLSYQRGRELDSYGETRPRSFGSRKPITLALVDTMQAAGFGLRMEIYGGRIHGTTPTDTACLRELQANPRIVSLVALFERDVDPRTQPEITAALETSTYEPDLRARLLATALQFRADRRSPYGKKEGPLHLEARELLPDGQGFLTPEELVGLVREVVNGSVNPTPKTS